MAETDEIQNVLAGLAVRDMDASVAWMTHVIGRAPDATPMEGLTDWYLGDAGTVQLVADAERAGGSMMTIVVTSIEDTASRLGSEGIVLDYDDTTSDKVRFGTLTDPDGNSVTVVETKEQP